jgi:hypothetical protein
MEKTVEGIQKKVNDAECYVNLLRDQPNDNAAPTVAGWIQNLNCDIERLKTEFRLNKESTDLEFKKVSEGANHHKYRIEQVEQSHNGIRELIGDINNDLTEMLTHKEAGASSTLRLD